MKIAIVVSTFPPYPGGIGNVAYRHAVELNRLGYDVTVFTIGKNIPSHKFKVKAFQPKVKYGNAGFIPGLVRQLKGFDIIHLHYPFFGGAEVIWQHANRFKQGGSKLVIHYHMDTIGRGWSGLIFAFHRKFITPNIISQADLVIGTSDDYLKQSSIARLVERWPGKFVIVPNGVDPHSFTDKHELYRPPDISKLTAGDRAILFVGGLDQAHYFKGVEYLLKAWRQLLDQGTSNAIKLIIVGDGDLKPRYESLASQLNLFDKVIFAGAVPNDQLVAYYQRSDLTVLPSIDASEAFGMVLIESLACGTPVIATNLAGVRSVVTPEVGLLAEPKSIDDLADKIAELISNPDKLKSMGTSGRKLAVSNYDWQKIGGQLTSLYKELLTTPSP